MIITPRRTRLFRVPDLRAYRAVIEEQVRAGGPESVVVVPTRSAGRMLRPAARVVTRDELYEHLHARLARPPRLLTPLERDAIAQASARAAAERTEVTFTLRQGLVAEMLRFYDELRRQATAFARSDEHDERPRASHQVRRFRELILAALGNDEVDRGARRLRQQTLFLAAAFEEYESRVRASGAVDEHGLRERLIAEPAQAPVERIIVTVADWIADPDGLFVADFDLLSRIAGLGYVDVVSTERVLASGFHQRIHDWLPGIEEQPHGAHGAGEATPPAPLRLVTPPGAPAETLWWTHRDREEELCAVARQVKQDRRARGGVAADRIAVVFKKPLPYLYLARDVFPSAGIPYGALDALPLAGHPAAAALDLILDAAGANFTRDTLIALLRSPHLTFAPDDDPVPRESIAALDRELSRVRYLGDPARLEELESLRQCGAAASASRAALAIALELAPLRDPERASASLRRLLRFWETHRRQHGEPDEHRARAAIAQTLESLAAVHEAHHDPEWTLGDLSLAVRRAIEEQTFEPLEPGPHAGIRLLDDRAARYGDFDDLFIVGLVDSDWPERPRRNIFYPPALLKALGWPSEKDRRSAMDASFLDLACAAARHVTISAFTLEDDALVPRSMQLDELPHAGLSAVARQPAMPARIFDDEALSLDPVAWDALEEVPTSWARVRAARSDAADARFHGAAPPPADHVWSVSALETYIGCPFRFFARHVLGLEEDPTDEEVMDPRRQGQFVHEVFEKFFDRWQQTGRGAITQASLPEARELFAQVIEGCLAALPDAEAGLERTRLLGSPAAAGLGEAVMRMEAERPVPVIERLVEQPLVGEFTIETEGGPRRVRIKGKADRLDLLADGTFRLIDYKLGWPPDRRKALQLPIYGLCAEQRLQAYNGRKWRLGEALYLAFKGPRRVVPLFQDAGDAAAAMADAQQRLAETLDGIAAGRFPPTPDDVYRCETCSYTAVCRKDYVGDV